MFSLSQLSRQKMKNVHPDLVRVIELAITLTKVDFRVIEGVRTLEWQKQLVKAGASQTLRSRHLGPISHAVDLMAQVGGDIRWDWPLYFKIASAMKKAARQENVPIEWGGDWINFRDGPHFQLPWEKYPA